LHQCAPSHSGNSDSHSDHSKQCHAFTGATVLNHNCYDSDETKTHTEHSATWKFFSQQHSAQHSGHNRMQCSDESTDARRKAMIDGDPHASEVHRVNADSHDYLGREL
jgi:hypothetical protein